MSEVPGYDHAPGWGSDLLPKMWVCRECGSLVHKPDWHSRWHQAQDVRITPTEDKT